jgi:hypothetical protein
VQSCLTIERARRLGHVTAESSLAFRWHSYRYRGQVGVRTICECGLADSAEAAAESDKICTLVIVFAHGLALHQPQLRVRSDKPNVHMLHI